MKSSYQKNIYYYKSINHHDLYAYMNSKKQMITKKPKSSDRDTHHCTKE